MHHPKFLTEEGLDEEYRELLKSLPSESSIVGINLYEYQGFWHSGRYLQGILNCQKHFQAQNSDVIIVTSPKCGTSWLKALTFALLNRTRYPNPDDQNHPFTSMNPHDIVPFLEIRLYVDNQLPDFSTMGSPRILSTHIPFVSLPKSVKDSDSTCKIVYLCRNPKDTLVSYWHFANKLRAKIDSGPISLEEAFDKFCRGVSIYGPYWDHVLEYWKESLEMPRKVMFLKYEDLKKEPEINLKKLADFIGCPFSLEEERSGEVEKILNLCSFENLSNLEVNRTGNLVTGEDNKFYYRRGEVGDYVNLLSVEMIQHLDRVTQEKFNDYGLRF